MTANHNNAVLKALGRTSIERLNLEHVKLAAGIHLQIPETGINHLYFIEYGLAVSITNFADFSCVLGSSLFSHQSIIGTSVFMGSNLSVGGVLMKIAGEGYRCGVDAGRAEFALQGDFQSLVLRSAQVRLFSLEQSIGCSAKHGPRQRLAQCLLLCAQHLQSKSFPLTHHSLAQMLGCTRSTLTLAARKLLTAGLISYHRGIITIKDESGLVKAACECYPKMKDALNTIPEEYFCEWPQVEH